MAEPNEPSFETRSSKLAKARGELTNNPSITQPLEVALNQVISQHSDIVTPINMSAFHRSFEAVKNIGRKALDGRIVPSGELLFSLSETYFSLGERLAPFYGDFAKWVNTFQDSGNLTDFIFHGRDSLGFLVAYSQLYGIANSRYSPVTRNTFNFYGLDSPEAQIHLAKLQADYLAKGRLDRKQVFVDFGFKGSNPRKELLLATRLFGRTPDANILLAYYDQDGHDFVEEYIWNNFPRSKREDFKAVNSKLREKTIGYINTFSPEFANRMHDDPLFREAFQELSSYIKESPDVETTSTSSATKDYVVLPVYELAAKYSFLRGLLSRFQAGINITPESAKASLDLFYKLYSANSNLFAGFKDFSTRYVYDPRFKATIDGLNRDLKQMSQNQYKG